MTREGGTDTNLMEEVRAGARAVTERAVHVSIDQTAVEVLAARIAAETRGRGEARDATGAGWDEAIHYVGPEGATVQYLLVLDALNFCFWPSEGTWEYADLSSALKTAAEGDAGALSAEALAGMDEARLRALLGGRDLPDMPTRVRLLREVGSVLNDKYGGSAARLVEECGGSAVALVAAVVRDFPGFRDEAHHPSVGKVQFYKRAQIFVGDVYGALKGQGLGRFMDVGELTMFADYRVPQILREVGVLQYSPSLASKIDGFEEIDAGCEEEVEIRALTIQAVEILTAVLRDKHAAPLIPIQVDWFLWEEGERLALAGKLAPHHRTRTSFY